MSDHHALVDAFREGGFALNATLEGMFDEHFEHQSERRGCGFTQATRHLAERINQPRADAGFDDLSLFREWHDAATAASLRRELDAGRIADWRDLDRSVRSGDPATAEWLSAEARRQAELRALPERMTNPESTLVAAMIRDLVLPMRDGGSGSVVLHTWPERLPVGSCPLAEKCFLELAHGFITRQGRANLLVDHRDRPVLIEKRHMGDDHSCISLQPVLVNGVRVPAGSLFAVHYDPDRIACEPAHGPLPGERIRIADCAGFRLLRLTTLAVAPVDRARAFSAHFEAQKREGLFEPDTTELDDLKAVTGRSYA